MPPAPTTLLTIVRMIPRAMSLLRSMWRAWARSAARPAARCRSARGDRGRTCACRLGSAASCARACDPLQLLVAIARPGAASRSRREPATRRSTGLRIAPSFFVVGHVGVRLMGGRCRINRPPELVIAEAALVNVMPPIVGTPACCACSRATMPRQKVTPRRIAARSAITGAVRPLALVRRTSWPASASVSASRPLLDAPGLRR
jgi:hypothetical protein